MNVQDMQRLNAAARLDRLPLFSFHHTILALLSFCFFFELGDINTFAFSAPAIRMQWGIGVDTISYVLSATFLGMFLGATTGGWFADRVGRKRALIAATVWYSGFSLLNAFVWEPYGLIAARFLTGIGLSAMTAIGITYIAEMIPARARGTYQGWVMTMGLAGIPVAAFVARFLIPYAAWGWRMVFVWGAIGLIFPILARRLEESPRWHEHRGDHAAAEAVMTRIEARAAKECGPLPAVAITAPAPAPSPEDPHRLFAPNVRGRTNMLIVVWIFQTVGFYGFSQWVPTLLVAQGFSLVTSLTWTTAIQLGGLPGALIAASVSDRFQRKWLIVLFGGMTGLCGLFFGMTFEQVFIILFGALFTLFVQGFAPLLYAYTAECFPTGVRSSGTGLTYGIGRLGNAVGPLVIAFLYTNYGYRSVFIFLALCWVVVVTTIGFFGPKTRGHTL